MLEAADSARSWTDDAAAAMGAAAAAAAVDAMVRELRRCLSSMSRTGMAMATGGGRRRIAARGEDAARAGAGATTSLGAWAGGAAMASARSRWRASGPLDLLALAVLLKRLLLLEAVEVSDLVFAQDAAVALRPPHVVGTVHCESCRPRARAKEGGTFLWKHARMLGLGRRASPVRPGKTSPV
jgi:hypothetical protein